MRCLIIFLFFLMAYTVNASASWYIVNKDNQIVSIVDYQPNIKDLESRQEIAVEGATVIPFAKAEYRSGKIVQKIETTKEKADSVASAEKIAEESVILKKAKEMAYKQLVADGVIFKQVTENDFK